MVYYLLGYTIDVSGYIRQVDIVLKGESKLGHQDGVGGSHMRRFRYLGRRQARCNEF